jgi:hypothetical protein
MRDINRIDTFLEELGKEWKKVPDWRFGQLMVNVLGACKRDPFFIEEPEMLKHFQDFFNKESQ